MEFRSIYGTGDILPEDSFKWQHIEEKVKKIMAFYNYKEIRTPIFESTQLFSRSIGEDTDIVRKEMYTFLDQGKRSLTLRPEATASVVRAYLEHNLGKVFPLVKLYYIGPMFRQERPQKGRLRQFHQFGAESIGSLDPLVDAELIELSTRIHHDLGIEDYTLHLNSIGCKKCRSAHRDLFIKFIKDRFENFCSECQLRLNRNPLRIFDCKKEGCVKILAFAPKMIDFLCEECRTHFERVKSYLKKLGIEYKEDPSLVRGLDYYTKTVYELKSSLLGAQDTLCGGGRYDLLIEELGGEQTPAMGFSAGMERILLVLEFKKKKLGEDERLDFFICPLGQGAKEKALKLIKDIRGKNLRSDMDYLNRSLKSQMKEANRQKAKKVLIIGEEELKKGVIILKDMESGEQKEIGMNELLNEISGYEE